MSKRAGAFSLAGVLLLGTGCATYERPIPVDSKICMVLGAAAVGAGAGAVANDNENDHYDINWAIAGGAVGGAALGYLLCGKPAPSESPTVRASADPASGDAPLATRLRATGSDPDGEIVGYAWEFGDGESATGSEVRHTYEKAGEYRARVTVTDNDGLTGSATVSVRATEAAAPAPPPPPPVTRRIVLRGVNFAFDSAEITSESEVILDAAADSLKESPGVRVEVAGHTDSTGPEAYNEGLSKRRAQAVFDYLTGQGIDASRLDAAGYGESRPVADNGTRDGRAQNRRVELNVLQ
jgi:outer membrane protein OmpA-like peptidoglycan-associated protein